MHVCIRSLLPDNTVLLKTSAWARPDAPSTNV